jgi:periplasmic divalent cation tolerance protein
MAESNSLMLVLTTEGDAMRAKALARSLLERGLVALCELASRGSFLCLGGGDPDGW